MMFGSSMRFLGSADLIVQLSVTLSDPKPQIQGHSKVQRQISRATAKYISALCVYDGYTILKTILPHFQMTRTSRGPSATAELLVLVSCPSLRCHRLNGGVQFKPYVTGGDISFCGKLCDFLTCLWSTLTLTVSRCFR